MPGKEYDAVGLMVHKKQYLHFQGTVQVVSISAGI
jgi:hypothetical protein